MSFQGTLSHLRPWSAMLAGAPGSDHARLYGQLISTLGQLKLPHRPNRCEPRAVKRRPKNYQRLTKPRRLFSEIPHRNRYRREKI